MRGSGSVLDDPMVRQWLHWSRRRFRPAASGRELAANDESGTVKPSTGCSRARRRGSDQRPRDRALRRSGGVAAQTAEGALAGAS